MLDNKIKKRLREALNNSDIWYHGTPDVRELEKEGRFLGRQTSVRYIKDLKAYYELQEKLKISREEGNDKMYHKYLDMVPKTYGNFTMSTPVFLTNVYSVAKTYANDKRAIDYQNSIQKVLKVKVTSNNGVAISATGDKFRFIDVNKVKRGFLNAGVDEKTLNEVISRFNYYLSNNDGIKTDMIAAIAQWLDFDYVDVLGVLDSYEGGSTKSTVKMVFNPNNIEIIK